MISLVWAMDKNRLIGKGDRLPWHIPEDLERFKDITKNKIVLMGDATYQSMKGYYKSTPLPFSKIYVANLEKTEYSDAIWVEDAAKMLEENNEELYVIAGSTMYGIALPYATNLYITLIYREYEGDSYFPEFDIEKFKLVETDMRTNLCFMKFTRNTEEG